MTSAKKTGPIEVWLSQANMQITCRVVYEDESVGYRDIDSLSMRGAQREVTGYLINDGYAPAGRWEVEVADERSSETSRKFKPAPKPLLKPAE